MKTRIGFIGTGNMGAAILKGILRSGMAQPRDIYIFDPDESRGKH